ncbi:MAG TPA: WHG domain-containing protein [Jiangellaceae bacterium]|jgi:AcrR family transcriptional regulator|nr:WHG domain-containing protein [Jiangellaceae bacterium]
MGRATTTRPTYHHGDLRNALIAAGAKLAEQGGPTAVGVRAAARVVGVTPTAAYRHFANAEALQGAVKERAFDVLAGGMRTELATLEPTGDAAEDARRRLYAIGRAYLRVALAEPGLFRTAFGEERGSPATARQTDASFLMLSRGLDDLVATGYLPAERRPLAEFAAWSAVHGLAHLILDGPLAELATDARDAVLERTLDMVARGL